MFAHAMCAVGPRKLQQTTTDMPPGPISLRWPGKHAILFVHGVGNASAGDYATLVGSVRALLGPHASEFAIYELYYDMYNDWMTDKLPLSDAVAAFTSAIKQDLGSDELAEAAAEFAGDIIWPVLHLAPRSILREVYLAQLKQIVRDGLRAGVSAWNQQISIICHSLGCFHTYEALHAAADDPAHALRPISNGVTFANVIYMASPVQLIRSVASRILPLIPRPGELATLRGDSLTMPGERSVTGFMGNSVKRWVSISGELDPVCGFVYRKRVDRYWMDVQGQESLFDDQRLLSIGNPADLARCLRESISANSRPTIAATNPHSWQGYIDRHQDKLRQWLTT